MSRFKWDGKVDVESSQQLRHKRLPRPDTLRTGSWNGKWYFTQFLLGTKDIRA